MEVSGNVELIKSSIKNKYDKEIKKVEKELQKKLDDINQKTKKEIELLKSHAEIVHDTESKKAYSKILSEESLKAKKEFEEEREKFIESIFEEALKKAKDVAHSKEYVDFVKSKIPQEDNIEIIGDSNYYGKEFGKIKIDKNIIGLKFIVGQTMYDFSLDGIINSKRDILRHTISKVLFS